MTRQFLATIRSRAMRLWGRECPPTATTPPPSPDEAQDDATGDVLRGLSVVRRSDPSGKVTLGAMFASESHRSDWLPERLDAEIRARAAAIDRLQPGYQPVFGFTDEYPGKRAEHLERNVSIVLDTLKDIGPRHQVRILDVGCNSGYVSLRVAQTFPNVVGLEISRQNLELCRLLAARAESSARFFEDDVLAVVESEDGDLESVDVVLLYNVVHQFIFHHGFEKTKALLAKLARGVDTVIVELALKADYVRHGKDHLLPENPEAVLEACEDVHITKLYDRPRPVYRLQRKAVRMASIELRPQRVDFSPNPDPRVSRKYYTGEGKFLKLYRFADEHHHGMVDREVDALGKLQHTDIVPRLLGHVVKPTYAAVLMSLVDGERLVPRIYNHTRYRLQHADRMRLTQEYLKVAKLVHDAVGYQNDLQAHNLLVRGSGSLVLVDFEQAGPEPVNDPFGLLLWSVFDIWGGRDTNRPSAIRSLRLAKGSAAAAEHQFLYPNLSGLQLPPIVAALCEAAAQRGDWGEFLAQWLPRVQAGSAERTAGH